MANSPQENVHRLPRSRFREWPISLVLLGIGLSMIFVATDHFRRGSLILAVSVVLAIFLRLFLPENQAGMLAVRSKSVDVAILTVLGVGLTVFALWVPAPN
jgi:multisubunit Na+/H+ antiporter MnhB subunit